GSARPRRGRPIGQAAVPRCEGCGTTPWPRPRLATTSWLFRTFDTAGELVGVGWEHAGRGQPGSQEDPLVRVRAAVGWPPSPILNSPAVSNVRMNQNAVARCRVRGFTLIQVGFTVDSGKRFFPEGSNRRLSSSSMP